MRLIKRLHWFVLKTFLPLFAMTFFIVLFIVLMQFLWKYIDDLVGKGLSMDVLAELFFYAAVSMVPMALPLAILLAGLMTFGNLGEKFELTAMKASGISLIRVMQPLIGLIMLVAVGAFFFQNDVLPRAQVKMWTLLFSMKQKSPELEIPEGVFYDQIPGYNLYVQSKNRDTGMMHHVKIYDVSHGGENASILLADSAQLAFTPDMKYLYLHLYQGEQFENLKEQTPGDRNVPFRRETFEDKQILIPFDANFTRLNEEGMRNQYVGKNIKELRHTIDSVGTRLDSLGRVYAPDLAYQTMPLAAAGADRSYTQSLSYANTSLPGAPTSSSPAQSHQGKKSDSNTDKKDAPEAKPLDISSVLKNLDPARRNEIFAAASSLSRQREADMEFRASEIKSEHVTIRRHSIELLKKFTLSVACIVFFFIGAPLGAIIRKGGIGTPLVISVLLFLVYYIIDNTGYKMAREGHVAVWFGMWLSTFILAPLGIYVTYKAMNDSSVFDKDAYINLYRRIFGINPPRSVRFKEVIINDISDAEAIERMLSLRDRALDFCTRQAAPQSYITYWMKGYDNAAIRDFGTCLDNDIDYMSDCRDLKVVDLLSAFPVITAKWMYQPSRRRWLSYIMMVLLPVGLTIWLIGLGYQRRLKASMRSVADNALRIATQLGYTPPTPEPLSISDADAPSQVPTPDETDTSSQEISADEVDTSSEENFTDEADTTSETDTQ